MVQRDAARDPGEQRLDGGPPGVGVQPADDRDRQLGHVGQPRFFPAPYRFSNFSTRPAVSSTRAVPV